MWGHSIPAPPAHQKSAFDIGEGIGSWIPFYPLIDQPFPKAYLWVIIPEVTEVNRKGIFETGYTSYLARSVEHCKEGLVRS